MGFVVIVSEKLSMFWCRVFCRLGRGFFWIRVLEEFFLFRRGSFFYLREDEVEVEGWGCYF